MSYLGPFQIWKVTLPRTTFGEEISIEVPKYSEFQDIQFQFNMGMDQKELVAWFKVRPTETAKESIGFIIYATGQPFNYEHPFRHIKTLQYNGLVYHVYGDL